MLRHVVFVTGLAQCAELSWQLRGEAEKRQVPGASVALQVRRHWAARRRVTAGRAAASHVARYLCPLRRYLCPLR